VQEAYSKWPDLKRDYPDLQLHLVGHLQSNKAKEAVALFDVIQTLDSLHLAQRLAQEEVKQHKHLSYYIEVNIGREPQKTGVLPEDFADFLAELRRTHPLRIEGVMCIPPRDQNPSPYFHALADIAHQHQLANISMGMSDDYEQAIQNQSTMVRIGRALFP
jgi:pyridoxal phosphate enzyme (YggS family)